MVPTSLSSEEGSDLLLYVLNTHNPSQQDRTTAKLISETVGGLPIVVAHIAGYMTTSQMMPAEVLEKFRTHQAYKIWRTPNHCSIYRHETLDMVWQTALEELSPEARDLLYVLAFMGTDDAIPESMLNGCNNDSDIQEE